jgi:MYXO-CTERM domain-containing protein
VRVFAVLLGASLLAPLACSSVPGELGELGFRLDLADILSEYRSGDRVLVGTTICPKLDDGDEVLSCMEEMISGPAQFDDDRCWSLDTPGEVTWTLSPNGECEHDGDSIRLQIVEPSASLRLGFDDWRERSPSAAWLVQDATAEMIGLAPGRTLADLREDPSAPRLVINGQLDAPMLRLDDELGRVWFDELELEIVGEGAMEVDPEPNPEGKGLYGDGVHEFPLPGERPLLLSPSAVVRIRATLPSGEILESPELISVPPSTAASLDLMVTSASELQPMYAYAEVRDAQGRVLHGAPVEWSVDEGALAVQPGDLTTEARTQEYAVLGLGCEPPPSEPTERHATLIARLGELEDRVEVTWTALPEEPDSFNDPFEPDENCMFGDASEDPDVQDFGCACTSDERAPASPGLLLLGLLAIRRRR